MSTVNAELQVEQFLERTEVLLGLLDISDVKELEDDKDVNTYELLVRSSKLFCEVLPNIKSRFNWLMTEDENSDYHVYELWDSFKEDFDICKRLLLRARKLATSLRKFFASVYPDESNRQLDRRFFLVYSHNVSHHKKYMSDL